LYCIRRKKTSPREEKLRHGYTGTVHPGVLLLLRENYLRNASTEAAVFFIFHLSFFIYAAGIRYTGTVHPGVLLLLREKCLRILLSHKLPTSAGGHKCPPVQ